MQNTEVETGPSIVLIAVATILLAFTVLLVIQTGMMRRELDENSLLIQNLTDQLQSLTDENVNLRARTEHLGATLEQYQEKVRLYQDEIYELRLMANMSTNTSAVMDLARNVSLIVPAVMTRTTGDWWNRQTENVGVATHLQLEIVPGRGRVLVNTDPPMGEVFQDTAVTAKETAESVSGMGLRNYDLIFSVEAPDIIPSVDGPSAGAAMTLMILSLLEEREIDPTVSMTGTISPDRTIGPIGGAVEKAVAAEEAGASIFCIPKDNEYTEVVYQRRMGPFIIQRYSVREKTADLIAERTNLTVRVVETIEELYEIATYKGG
jgi:predicted S18 family serine protease